MVEVKLDGLVTKMPEKTADSSLSYDLYPSKWVTVSAGQTAKVPLGMALSLPEGYIGIISLNELHIKYKGFILKNGLKIIHSDYNEPIELELTNTLTKRLDARPCWPIARLNLIKVENTDFKQVEEFTPKNSKFGN